MVTEILAFNEQFVQDKKYQSYMTDKYPDKKVAILTCMDTRLVELLPKALNLRNGDAKIIKNAGAVLTQPFGSAMRSILIAIHEMDVQEVLVIGHHGCGMTNLDPDAMIKKFISNGISQEVLVTLENSGIKMERFLKGFDTAEEGVMHSVDMIRRHPLVPSHIPVHGFVMDPTTGRLELIHEGYADRGIKLEQAKSYPAVPFD
ncbi:Carbonate dehydratase [Paenibacillus curdlanolyticus YK9]|uniref:carbonic anhydrase n=1 Tax=Paenibacillus curdlanolyticus YK9 TaxID=717606 RepID=E0I625_9BACL|nr:carbonic anhydrase [Paenibacillus curdlanolyticus]EFM12417.1 Carbonate dehydratase [Paenibacillus curdlanolyticus YK9]